MQLSLFLVTGTAAAASNLFGLGEPQLRKRAECGPGIGSCNPGYCCSESGWCGNTTDYCEGSQCQLDYSDSCDTFFGPPGLSTENIPRPKVGNVPYGTIITSCSVPGTIALTFDDGPYLYTADMLDLLDELDVKATFFVAGNNRGKGSIDDPSHGWVDVLQRMHRAGHQIASHTWTHRDLNKVNATIQWTEIVYNEMAFRNIFGWIPTYMRPPYLECSSESGCADLLQSLGYHIISNNVDTKDYMNDSPQLIQNSKNSFDSGVSKDNDNNDYIVLAHDVHHQTVANLTSYMVQVSRDRGYKLVTVGECLGDPEENWYRQDLKPQTTTTTRPGASSKTSVSLPATTTKALTISPNQRCGGNTGYTCQDSAFGNCCSYYGYCGSDASYCGTGCDVDFGKCSPVLGTTSDTTNGLCGPMFAATCQNYGNKKCCSQFGYCGPSDEHCGKGCQADFGQCK